MKCGKCDKECNELYLVEDGIDDLYCEEDYVKFVQGDASREYIENVLGVDCTMH